MKKFIEVGLGNRWIIRTEYELEDGTEYEKKGMQLPEKFNSIYLRIWIGKSVLIIDSKQGCKLSKKSRSKLKIIVGISGTDPEAFRE